MVLWRKFKFAGLTMFHYMPHIVLFPFDLIHDMIKFHTLNLYKVWTARYSALALFILHLNWDPAEYKNFQDFLKVTLEDEKKRHKFQLETFFMVDLPIYSFMLIWSCVLGLMLRYILP